MGIIKCVEFDYAKPFQANVNKFDIYAILTVGIIHMLKNIQSLPLICMKVSTHAFSIILPILLPRPPSRARYL